MNDEQLEKLLNRNRTIPFLIGAEYLYTNEVISIKDFFNRIIETKSEKIYDYSYCSDIGEYVLSISHPVYKKKGIEIKNEYSEETKLILAQNTQILGEDLNILITKLEERYSEVIALKKFSCEYRQWRSFNDEEINFIMSV